MPNSKFLGVKVRMRMNYRKLWLESKNFQTGNRKGYKDRILEVSIAPMWKEASVAVFLVFRLIQSNVLVFILKKIVSVREIRQGGGELEQ